jgi:hypothetical protein
MSIKKPTELIQVGFTILFIKKTGLLISTLALPPETFTLVEFVPFLVLTSTHQFPRLSLFHQAFLLPWSFSDFNSLVSRSFWSFFFSLQETIAKTDNRPINIDIFSFYV